MRKRITFAVASVVAAFAVGGISGALVAGQSVDVVAGTAEIRTLALAVPGGEVPRAARQAAQPQRVARQAACRRGHDDPADAPRAGESTDGRRLVSQETGRAPERTRALERSQESDAGPTRRTQPRMHVVKAGESLWEIASDHLGETAGNAKIARRVQRMVELNEDRFASGDPDLIMPGESVRVA